MKRSLLMLIGIIIILAACSKEISKDIMLKDIDMITITGDGLEIFTENVDDEQKVAFKQTEEIEVLKKAIENSTPHSSGPMTTEGANLKIILSYKNDKSETLHLWLNADNDFGKIQKENYTGPTYILNEEDVQSIKKLLDKES